MRPTPIAATPLLLIALIAIAGCGSTATKTVSIGGQSGSSSVPTTSSPAAAATTTTTKSQPTQTSTTQTTRTATAPAFTKERTSSSEGLGQAVATVKAHGYTPEDTNQYRADQTLRVLIATRTGSADGYAQQAFFFVDGHYLGTDTSTASAGIKLVSQGDTEATLAYRLYKPGDPLCCARGGEADVRFQLNNGRLIALDPIPPANSSTAASRQ